MDLLTLKEALAVAAIVALGLLLAIAYDAIRRRRGKGPDDGPS